MEIQGRSILVTGGAGFIGSHLVEELVRHGANVTVVDNFSTGYASNLAAVDARIELRELDLLGVALHHVLLEKSYHLIFHVAANANVPMSVGNPRMDFEKNAVVTLNLLEAVREIAPQTPIIHTSSAAVYGRASTGFMREDHPTVPVSPYGVSKLASECYMTVYSQLYGLRAATLRLFPVYGPRLRKQVVYDLMQKVQENPHELFIQGDGKQERDFNHIANVVEAYLTVARDGQLNGEIYNVAAEETITIHDLAQMICERLKVTPRFVYSGDARPGDMQRLIADTSQLKNIGYSPLVSFADGLDNTVAWFREEISLKSAAC